MPPSSPHGQLFEATLAHCSRIVFSHPWDLVPPPQDCYGPVRDPEGALAALAGKFPLQDLSYAGVLDQGCDGKHRLCPALVSPLAVIIPLRHTRGQIFALLTARGCLPRSHLPLRDALRDHWTRKKVLRHRVLLATPYVREVALLRALRLPATLSLGIHRQPFELLRWLDARTAVQDYPPPAPAGRPATGAGGAPAPQLTLALLGWSALSLRPQPSPALFPLLAHLQHVRRHLGLDLAGVMAWRPSAGDLENLRFRLGLKNVPLVRQLLHERLDSLVDLSALGPAGGAAGPAPGFLAARAELMACLGGQDLADADRLPRAQAVYDDAVRRQLIEPLIEWALGEPDPMIRAAGTELANVAQILHGVGPQLHALAGDPQGRDGPLPPRELSQYCTLLDRFGRLLQVLLSLSSCTRARLGAPHVSYCGIGRSASTWSRHPSSCSAWCSSHSSSVSNVSRSRLSRRCPRRGVDSTA